MKWYFCLNEHGMNGFAESMFAAVHSALQNTTLEPHFIYDGAPNEITRYLQRIGVTVHFHQNSFLDRINAAKAQQGFNPAHARGAYLRLDIPVIDQTDDFVLYTDVDVLFPRDPRVDMKPELFAAAPEYAMLSSGPVPNKHVLNSGVMVINLGAFRKRLAGLIDFAAKHDFYFHGDSGFYDQGAINKFFPGEWEALPQRLNWRPFSGHQELPEIIHFHGTKPYELPQLIAGGKGVREVAGRFYNLNKTNYLMAFGLYMRFQTPETQRILGEAFPKAQRLSVYRRGGDGLPYKNDLCQFIFNDQFIRASRFYGSPYLDEFSGIISKYAAGKSLFRMLEWGSGFTSLLAPMVLDSRGVDFRLESIDDNPRYQRDLAKFVYAPGRIEFRLEDLTGPGKSQADPELNYSTSPLRNREGYDFIFIDGRRRVECAYIAALVSSPETIVVIHDFRRGRYQPVLGLFEVVEETEQFRVMKLRKGVHEALKPGRAEISSLR